MRHLGDLCLKLGIRMRHLPKDRKGQDLIEYALMAGFVAVAAGALMPNMVGSISTVFSKIASVTANAAAS